MLEMGVYAEIEDVINLLVQHGFGQAKGRYLAEHKAPALVLLVKKMYLVAQRGQVSRHRQRSRPRADQRYLFAVRSKRRLRHKRFDLALVIRGDAFQTADRHRLFLDAAAAAGGLAGAVAGAAEYAGKHVRIPVDHIRLGIPALSDQADILR